MSPGQALARALRTPALSATELDGISGSQLISIEDLYSTPWHFPSAEQSQSPPNMDSAIDLSDAAKALDLENIRFQLM